MGKRYLIDTNVIINFFGQKFPASTNTFLSALEPLISFITYIELFSSNNLQDKDILLLNSFVESATIFTQIDTRIIQTAISIRKNYNVKLPDAVIAATAIVHNLTLISGNIKDFEKIKELDFLNPLSIA